MKMTRKELIRVISFLVVFGLILSSLTKIFLPKWSGSGDTLSRISTFYSQPKNSIDVLFLGASSILSAISPLSIWENYGIASYVRASSVQAPVVTYNEFVESLKYQSPKVVVLDGISLFTAYDVDKNEGYLRKSIDPLKFSIQKLNIIYYIKTHSNSQTMASYIFPLLRFHSRWPKLTGNDFTYELHLNSDFQYGSNMWLESNPFELPKDFMNPTDTSETLDEESVGYYVKIIRLCREKGIDVIFVSLPKTNWTYSDHLAIAELAKEFGISYIDYNMPENSEAIGFDPATDFYNDGHVSISGALKISSHLGAFLKGNYDLLDRRGEAPYTKWDTDAQKFNEYILQ